jgi:nitroreductase
MALGKPDFVRENNMNVIEAIHRRHSYRGKFKDVTVPKEDLMKIMQAGLDAPSGCNKQTTSLIAVDDPEVLAKLHRVIEPPVGGDCTCGYLCSYAKN